MPKHGSSAALTTVDVSASTSATLYPGATGDVVLKIDNSNPYPVRITAVTGSGAVTADAGHSGCVTTGVTFVDQSGKSIDIAASSQTQVTLTGAAKCPMRPTTAARARPSRSPSPSPAPATPPSNGRQPPVQPAILVMTAPSLESRPVAQAAPGGSRPSWAPRAGRCWPVSAAALLLLLAYAGVVIGNVS